MIRVFVEDSIEAFDLNYWVVDPCGSLTVGNRYTDPSDTERVFKHKTYAPGTWRWVDDV